MLTNDIGCLKKQIEDEQAGNHRTHIENVSHDILRGRCNNILRVFLLAGCLACMMLLVYYLLEIVTGEGTLDYARGLCRDGPCEALLLKEGTGLQLRTSRRRRLYADVPPSAHWPGVVRLRWW